MRALLPATTVLAVVLLAGCASLSIAPPAPVVQVTQQAQVPPPDDTLNATAWFQTSVERDLVFREIYRAAGEKLATALADKGWDALPRDDRDNDPRALPPAIIVDVDETVLDNSPNQVRQIRGGGEFNDADWDRWVQQRDARALPGAREFLERAAAQGVTVFYISNRDAGQAAATFDNLRHAGFPIAGTRQFLGKGTVVAGCVARGSDKGCRRRSVGREYRVLMQFGDQVGDFVDIASNTRDGRRAAIAPYLDWVGERWWTLPNPVYGSWEPALFDNDWRQPAAARRAAKEAALDDARK
ncbi:acid phosphatase [Luteimonas sp. 50]|uniref:Acid phosphatase n=1 Tax=Cognatiluteimonas sedimenti TaxID=2927791 RepID=A0ABT0A5X4_9GAMM|nr:HAD family acid phosphatase [Lysobacter sedimenti]MCJ0826389.1 acid phosphatase [Lysobacter sedimenti]